MRNNWYLFILAFFCTGSLYAQNLVPNPGFEKLKTAPSCWNFGSKADFDSRIHNWFLPSEGSTDLLNTLVSPSCITALPVSTYPLVDWFPRGNQSPRSGNSVAGIKPFYDTRREYLEVELACAMTPGLQYYAEMYVSLAEGVNYAQNSLGMYFSDNLVYINTTANLPFSPQIVETAILEDTVHWVKISGTFTATGPHRYLLIGNFANSGSMAIKYLGHKSEVEFPYYYIDDVLVRPVVPPSLQITGDTIVCSGTALNLFATGWDNIKWYNASGALIGSGNNLLYRPETSTNLTVQGNTCNWIQSKNIQITLLPLPEVLFGEDTLICPGTTLTLDAGPGHTEYEWQNGSPTQTYQVNAPGTYTVKITGTNGCKKEEGIQIGYYNVPQVFLGEDQLTCLPEGMFQVGTGQAYDVYRWQDNSSGTDFQFRSEGSYWVTITNACGESASDTVTITKIQMVLPNLITPNGDAKNETFEILGTEKGKGKLSVYNRYGATVYSDEKYYNNWNGGNLSEDVYYFLFEYPACTPRKGWIQILR